MTMRILTIVVTLLSLGGALQAQAPPPLATKIATAKQLTDLALAELKKTPSYQLWELALRNQRALEDDAKAEQAKAAAEKK